MSLTPGLSFVYHHTENSSSELPEAQLAYIVHEDIKKNSIDPANNHHARAHPRRLPFSGCAQASGSSDPQVALAGGDPRAMIICLGARGGTARPLRPRRR